MTDRLIIDFRPEEGAVPRIVGLVERRGFELRGITMNGSSMTLDVSARDTVRTVDLLQRQLQRLDGVGAVATFSPPARASR
jgi:acetolactate synthase-1/3 small subunit/acetolactate synthase II small subunit